MIPTSRRKHAGQGKVPVEEVAPVRSEAQVRSEAPVRSEARVEGEVAPVPAQLSLPNAKKSWTHCSEHCSRTI